MGPGMPGPSDEADNGNVCAALCESFHTALAGNRIWPLQTRYAERRGIECHQGRRKHWQNRRLPKSKRWNGMAGRPSAAPW